MAVFDPTQPFTRGTVPQAVAQFDPSQPFQTGAPSPATQPGKIESFARGAAQGATFNFADEITAGLESLMSDKTYQNALAESRGNYQSAEQANPISYGAGNIGGGIGTAFIPGLGGGSLAKAAGWGAKAIQSGKIGAAMGAASSLGAAEDKGIDDVASGALYGSLGGAAFSALGSGIGAGARSIGHKLADAVDPDTQLAKAFGATGKELNPSRTNSKLYNKVTDSVRQMKMEGILEKEADAVLDENVLLSRLQAKLQERGGQIGSTVEKLGDKQLDPNTLRNLSLEIRERMADTLAKTAPVERSGVENAFNAALKELEDTKGSLAQLWKLKSESGHWAGNAWTKSGTPPEIQQGYMSMNSALNDFLTGQTSSHYGTIPELIALNKSYGAAATLEPLVGKSVQKIENQSGVLGFNRSEGYAGSLAAAGLAGMGAPGVLAAAGGLGVAAASAYSKSVPGRILRSKVGEVLERAVQKKAVFEGAIPRTVTGTQEWLRSHFPMLPPQMQGAAAAIIGAPPDRAEVLIRGVIPQFAQFFARSKYPSEMEGKVSSEDDKAAITRELQKMQMPSTALALRISALNKDGSIPSDVYDPSDYQNEMMGLAKEMMGGAF